MKAELNHDEEDLKLERINTWTKRRNKMLQKVLLDMRMKTAYKNEQNKITEYFALKKPKDIQYSNVEKEECIKEKTMKIPYARVEQYQKNDRKRNKRKCWFCYSPNHYKINCPKIRCFN